jgi:hypothetical protein
MASNANVRVWLKGQVLAGPLGTSLPTDVTTVLNAAFKDLGLLTDDGITDDPGRGVKNVLALGGINVRSFVETEEPTVKVVCLEENAIVQSIINPGGTPVTVSGVTTIPQAQYTPNPMAFVIVNNDGGIKSRQTIVRGEILEVGPRVMKADAATRELTIVKYFGSDGTTGKIITDDAALAAA